MQLLKYLKQPFPKAQSQWATIVAISLFVFLFLYIFKPFGIDASRNPQYLIHTLGYGLATFIALVFTLIFIEKVFSKAFEEDKWTIWKEFIWLAANIFLIAIANAIYTIIIFDGVPFSITIFANFQIATFKVASIPIVLLIVSKQSYFQKKHASSATNMNSKLQESSGQAPEQLITFTADKEKDSLTIRLADFYYIESAGNYINLYYLQQGKLLRNIFRHTMKAAEGLFKDCPEIIRCHRAFIVNTIQIAEVKGNSQGLRLTLKHIDCNISVSRAYVDQVKEIIAAR